MGSIAFRCPICAETLECHASLSGCPISCTHCGERIRVPGEIIEPEKDEPKPPEPVKPVVCKLCQSTSTPRKKSKLSMQGFLLALFIGLPLSFTVVLTPVGLIVVFLALAYGRNKSFVCSDCGAVIAERF
jgi:hypothetical protein